MAAESPRHERKTRLLRIIEGTDEKASQIEGVVQDYIQTARFSKDMVSCVRDIVRAVADDSYLTAPAWDRVEASLQAWNRTAAEIPGTLPTMANSFRAVSGSTTFTAFATSTGEAVERILAFDLTPDSRVVVEQAANRASKVLNTVPLFSAVAVKDGMIRLGLDRPRGNSRGPIELLEDAQAALAHPIRQNVGPVPVLIAMRESIQASLSALLARRPTQEPAGKASDKIRSIGEQCSIPNLPQDHFVRLGAEADTLLDRLSETKQQDLSRPEVMDRYNEALLLLQAFFDSLAETRLRQ